MREIKYRAYSLKDKKVYPVWGFQFFDGSMAINIYGLDQTQDEYVDAKYFEIMQFTGLKDRNNKEIYEGDILKASNRPQLYVVDWIKSMAAWFPFCKEEITMAGFEPVEIMGNIHQTPELLKVKETSTVH